jgi:hypothetical protein
MFRKIISQTIQAIWGLSGLVMEIIGIISNPIGPFGLSLLAWGAILVTTCSISIIFQLWFYIHKIDNSCAYTLSFDKLESFPNFQGKNLQLALLFSNVSDRPIEYRLDRSKTYLEMDGKRVTELKYDSISGIILKQKSAKFILPGIPLPKKYPTQGILHYEVEYGRPNRLRFRQSKEFDLEFTTLIQKGTILEIPLVYKKKYEEEKPIKKLENPIQIKDLRCL